jgi:O-antigen ligase
MGKQVIQFPKQIGMLFTILLITSILLPPLLLIPGLPKFHSSEFLLPLLMLSIGLNFSNKSFKRLRYDLLIQGALAIVIVVSMVFNHRIAQLRDWFEIFEVIKYVVLFLFVSQFAHLIDVRKVFKGVFIALVIFNFFQYFDWFEFNNLVEIYYGSDIQVSTFGLNSLGQPDTKRLLGTLGNPNNNGILFLFFSIFFFPNRDEKLVDSVFFLAAVALLLMCQSRTTTVAFTAIFFLGAYLKNLSFKQGLFYLMYFILIYLLLWTGGNSYLKTLSNNPMKESSVKGRMETFQILGKMIIKSPIIGYGPNKEFFDKHGLNSDNEYILYTWRYGFLGLFLYLSWLFRLAFQGWKSRFTSEGVNLLLFILGICISTLTNSPLGNPYLLFLLALSAGIFMNRQLNESTS